MIGRKKTAMAARLESFQRTTLEKLAAKLDKKIWSQDQIKLHLITQSALPDGENGDLIRRLDLLGAVRENFRTSMSFDDYHRAARYLAVLQRLCEKFL